MEKSLVMSSSLIFFIILLQLILGVVCLGTGDKLSVNRDMVYSEMGLPERVFGPESIAFDCKGEGPYAGVSDGRILKWKGPRLGWTHFAVTSPKRDGKLCDGTSDSNIEPTCGRPLGLKFDPSTCDLYIADAYFGLLVVGPKGGPAQQLANSAEGLPLRFTNALDIDSQTGDIYFTDSSILFQRRVWVYSIMNGDKTGRLLKYNRKTKQVSVLLKGLAFPNGVALSNNSSFLVMAETATLQILKFWLKGPKSNSIETLAQLERFPDNIKRNDAGEFWVAMNTGRGKLESPMSTRTDSASPPRAALKIPWLKADPVAVKFDGEGAVRGVVDGQDGQALESVSEVEDRMGKLWFGSAVKPYVGFMAFV